MGPPVPGRRPRPVFPPALSNLANHKFCAGLVPVNDLVYKPKNTKPTAGWVGWSQEMVRPTNSTPEGLGAERRTHLDSLQIPRRFDTINGCVICAKFESMD